MKYVNAPLPFMGQKKNFSKQFIKAIQPLAVDTVFVDLFGGSGLLSRFCKDTKPQSTVIYNDFDNYSERLKNIPLLNELRAELYEVSKKAKYKSNFNKYKNEILNIVEKYDKKGFNDYLTLSTMLLFSMNYVHSFEELKKETFYNCITKTPYNADGYLDGLTVVSEDYKALFEKYAQNPKAFFLIDPPYLTTNVGAYKNYWSLTDYLDVLKTLKEDKNFAFFTSQKSQLVDLLFWLSEHYGIFNPFANCDVHFKTYNVTNSGKNQDCFYFSSKYAKAEQLELI